MPVWAILVEAVLLTGFGILALRIAKSNGKDDYR